MIMPRHRRTISSIAKRAGLCGAAALVAAALLSPVPAAGQDLPDHLRAQSAKLAKEGQRNRVLNQMILGVGALEAGFTDIARSSLDDALTHIELTHAGTESARKARSLWYDEGTKDFKGEPYERAMAYYYRGVVYLMDRDYDNARACFQAGILQDSFAEEEQDRCDFALLYLLAAYACYHQGDLPARDEHFTAFKHYRPDFEEPKWEDTVLALVETGRAPRKLADGVGHYQMKLFRGKGFKDVAATLTVGDQQWNPYPTEDIYFQAASRGGRPVDAINEGKVQFKKRGEQFGTTLTGVASEAMVWGPAFGSNSSGAAGIIGGIGILSTLIASNAKPRADTRYWNNLPDTVHVAFLPRDVLGQTVTATFLDKTGAPLNQKQDTPTKDDRLIWFKNST